MKKESSFLSSLKPFRVLTAPAIGGILGATTRERTPMEPTKIQWSLGYTLNTGNFQNIRLDCQIQDYVRDNESAKQASDRIYALVEQQLIEKLNEAREELG